MTPALAIAIAGVSGYAAGAMLMLRKWVGQ